MSLVVKVNPSRVRPFNKQGSALKAFFDVDLGVTDGDGNFLGIATIPDFSLIQRNDGGFFAKEPEEVRRRNGEIVKDDQGNPRRDPKFKKFFGEDNKPTKLSYKLWDAITEKAVAALGQVEKGEVKKAETRVPANVGASVGQAETPSPLDELGDDFPF